MALFRSMGARKDAVRGTTPLEVRKGLANLFTGPGVLPGATSPLVVGTGSWAYQVRAAGFVTTRGTADGTHFFGNDGATNVATTVKPGAGLSRIDIIWVRHPSATENGETTSEPEFGVTQGTPASVPVAPTIPIGALELARNTMTSAATSTASAGNTITQTAARAGLRGTVSRIGMARLSVDSGSVTTEAAVQICAATTVSGNVRLTVSGQILGTAAGDVVVVRVRDGSATGTERTGATYAIPSGLATGITLVDSVTVAPGAHTFYVTLQRASGTGTVRAGANFRTIVDEDTV